MAPLKEEEEERENYWIFEVPILETYPIEEEQWIYYELGETVWNSAGIVVYNWDIDNLKLFTPENIKDLLWKIPQEEAVILDLNRKPKFLLEQLKLRIHGSFPSGKIDILEQNYYCSDVIPEFAQRSYCCIVPP